jgi:hypothetical protein
MSIDLRTRGIHHAYRYPATNIGNIGESRLLFDSAGPPAISPLTPTETAERESRDPNRPRRKVSEPVRGRLECNCAPAVNRRQGRRDSVELLGSGLAVDDGHDGGVPQVHL